MKKVILLFPILLILLPRIGIMASENYYPEPGQIKISAVNPSENWVRIKNYGNTVVDLAGWVLYDENDTHELFLTEPDIIKDDAGGGLILAPGSEITISGKNDVDLQLHNAGGELKLFSGPVEISGTLEDQYSYPAAGEKNYQETDIIDNTYQIPENSDNKFKLKDQVTQSENSDPNPKQDKEEKKNENETEPKVFKSSNDNIFISPPTQIENSSTPTFTASAPLVKSSAGWFYWIYNSWFLRRIIIPLLVIWVFLFILSFLVRYYYDRK